MDFDFVMLPRRIVFGAGRSGTLSGEIGRLGASRCFIISSPGRRSVADALADALGPACVGTFADASGAWTEQTATEVRRTVRQMGSDCVVALGGGTALDFGKYVALPDELPIVTIPTTYSGAELTPGFRLYQDGEKVAAADMRALPKTIIYDPLLTLDLPPSLSVATGMNAMAHAVESFYSANRNPVTAMLAEEAIRRLRASLPIVIQRPADVASRTDALYGAYLGISATNMAGLSIHHRVSQTLGGAFHMDHGAVNAAMLPQMVKFCMPAVPSLARVAAALGTTSAARGLFDFAAQIGAPTSLRSIGMTESDLAKAAGVCMPRISHSPRPVDEAALRQILEDAFHGRRPEGA